MLAVQKELRGLANPTLAQSLGRFFKTGPGEYAEGDRFLGVKVPPIRALAKKYSELTFPDLQILLESEFHEERVLGVITLVMRARTAKTDADLGKIYSFYVKNRRYINNWDLVDISAEHITGAYLYKRPKNQLTEWAKSSLLWERRIAIISTFHYIRRNEFKETLRISKILLNDEHDLIHKAVGWMLRETGKRDLKTQEAFMRQYYKKMPRTMLRYAIEKFPEEKRKTYLLGNL